jgi:hypothetical protein
MHETKELKPQDEERLVLFIIIFCFALLGGSLMIFILQVFYD